MVDKDPDEMQLNEEEQKNVNALSRELETSSRLEDRVVTALKAQHLILPPFWKRSSRIAAVIAACTLFFGVGMWIGVRQMGSPKGGMTMSESTFVLFLLEGASYQTTSDSRQEELRINEYRSWARSIRAERIALTGVKLHSEASYLGTGLQASGVSGYFLIEAKNLEQAIAIARTCPHLHYGGRIEIRRIHAV